MPSIPGPNVEAFRQGLKDLGYVEGKNILIEFRYAEGKPDRVPSLVAELVQLKVDVLVSGDAPAIRIAKHATKTIPIVMVINQDPVATGLVDSLARPGGNITGISRLTRELSGKRLELLTEVVPQLSRVGILWAATSEGSKISFQEYQAAARGLKIQLQSLEVRGPEPDLGGAFQSAVKGRASALITIGNTLLNRHRKQIADYAIKHRLPSMYESSLWIEPGGLISYSSSEGYERPHPDFEAAFQTAAKGRVNALITITNGLINFYRKQIVELAKKNRLASMFEASSWVKAGGLVSYSTDDTASYRRAASLC